MSRAFLLILTVLCICLISTASIFARADTDTELTSGSRFTAPQTSFDKSAASVWVPPELLSWLRTGEIGATATNSGTFGTGFFPTPLCDGGVCPSFVSPEDSELEYLFAGAVWVGGIVGSDTLVSVGADGWFQTMEMLPPVPSDSFFSVSDYSAWMLYTDTISDPYYINVDPIDNRPHHPLNVRIANRAHSWTSDPENQMIIYDMVITNIGEATITDGYVGYYFDADVYHESNSSGGFQDDLTGALHNDGIAYIIDNDGDPVAGEYTFTSPTRIFAFRPLLASFPMPDTAYNWWISNGNAALDYGPQRDDGFGNPECIFNSHLGTPTGDRSKYCMLSHPGWDFDQIYTADTIPGWIPMPGSPALAADFADGFDTRFLMSFGPFDLLPDSSVRLQYAIFTGEDVHQDPANASNLVVDPDAYLAGLDFSDVVANAAVADSIAIELLNPLNPAMGLYVLENTPASVTLEWDPWAFSEVEGYDIFIYEIPDDSMPYPGVAPPWITPTTLDYVASVGQSYRYDLTGLSTHELYLAAVANRTPAKAIGALSKPVLVQPGGRPPAPIVDGKYILTHPGDPAVLEWSAPDGVTIDHYNIYKFAGAEEAESKYYPFYDNGEFSATTAPKDSFFVDGTWYYYYAMEPYHQVDASITTFTEYTEDSVVYVVTAVMPSGVESAFSNDATVLEAPPQTKDILVLLCPARNDFVFCDSITAYYDDVLSGYDYELYYFYDTTVFGDGCNDNLWYDLMQYRMVILDGGWRSDMLTDYSEQFCGTILQLQKFVWSGGVLAYFGSFIQALGIHQSYPPDWYPAYNNFVKDGMGIDSVYATGSAYYGPDPSGFKDTLGGFIRAESHFDPSFDLEYDSTENPYQYLFWPDSVGPMASAFVPNENATPIYTYRSLYPGISIAEGHPVGVVSNVFPSPIFSFGFRPWYMKRAQFTHLVDALIDAAGDFASASAVIDPDTMHVLWAYALDPEDATITVGDFSDGYFAGEVDQASLRVNGGALPTDVTVVGSHPDFTGEVLQVTVPIPAFLTSYGPLWGQKVHPFVVTGTMTDGAALSAAGDVFIKGLLVGDVNSNGVFNVADIVALVNYVYHSGKPPLTLTVADVNADCVVNMADIVYMINYLLRGGSDLQLGCVE